MYRFTKRAGQSFLPHAHHAWEEWHAYLSSEYPEWVSANDTGVCCHTCRLVIVD